METDEYMLRKNRNRNRKDSGHTTRHISGMPVPHSARKAFDHGRSNYPKDHVGDPHVRDYKHVPITKTYSCKLRENKKGRQWLQNVRRYERHVVRNERRAETYQEEIAESKDDVHSREEEE